MRRGAHCFFKKRAKPKPGGSERGDAEAQPVKAKLAVNFD
jgi:hypothetical protein